MNSQPSDYEFLPLTTRPYTLNLTDYSVSSLHIYFVSKCDLFETSHFCRLKSKRHDMTVICASKNHNSLVTIRDKLIAEKEGERKCQTDRVERLTNLELLATGSIT